MWSARGFVDISRSHRSVVQALIVNWLKLFSVCEVHLHHGCALNNNYFVFFVFLYDESTESLALSQKEVCNLRIVNLNHLARNFERIIRRVFQFSFKVLKCLLDQSISFVWTALHGLWFTCPCLSINEDSGLQASDCVFDLWFDRLENVLLCCLLEKNFSELDNLKFCFSAGHLNDITVCQIARFVSFRG